MISNERRWPSHRQPQPQRYYGQQQPYYERHNQMPPRPPVQEDTLETRQLQIERKNFLLTLKENPRGRFLRIAEETNGRFNSIIIPATGLEDFKKLVDELVKSAREIPEKPSASPQSDAPDANGA